MAEILELFLVKVLTLASNAIESLFLDWKVLGDHSLSDHRYIAFSLWALRSSRKIYKNFRKTELGPVGLVYYKSGLRKARGVCGKTSAMRWQAIMNLQGSGASSQRSSFP